MDAVDEFLRASPNFGAALAVLAVIGGAGWAVLRWHGVRLGVWHVLLAIAVGLLAAATLSPANQRAVFAECQLIGFRRYVIPGMGHQRLTEASLNTLLFVPIGGLGVLAFRRPMAVIVVGAGVVVAIEALQSLVPALGRACDSLDVQANVLGLAAGALAAWVLVSAGKVYSRR